MNRIFAKTFIITSIILSIHFSSNAQVAHTWSIGGEIGPSFSRFGGDAEDQQFKSGLLVGGFLTYSVVNNFAVTFKALYSQKGTRFDDEGVIIKQSLNYLELPLIGRFFLNREGRFRPNIFVGPSVGVLLGVKNKRGEGDFISAPAEQRKNFSDFDLGLTGGLGLNYEILNETRILVDARYTYGLTDIANPGKINNNALGVTLGMSFGF